MGSVSIYFYAGDFADVLRRHAEGRQQIYQTHDEVARLIHELLAANYKVNFYSFVTPEYRVERPLNGFRFVSLGAKNYLTPSLLKNAVAEDDAEVIVAHFPNMELLNAVAASRARSMAILANSYNRTGVRSFFGKYKVVRLLNSPRFELVSNHCIPATEHLAHIGVKREKLIAWDIPHPFFPTAGSSKKFTHRQRFEAVYAGSIIEGKGITDLIRALSLLRKEGLEVHCSLAGLGDIDAMQAFAAELGVSELLSFVKLIGNPEVFRMMKEADLVVVPSRTEYAEGFPLTMFEAIASLTPIVCSDHPMFRSVMRDGQNASVFRAGDYRAFATAIRRTLTDPVLYAALSANAIATWKALQGPADWRTMIVKWVTEGPSSQWIRQHMLSSVELTASLPSYESA